MKFRNNTILYIVSIILSFFLFSTDVYSIEKDKFESRNFAPMNSMFRDMIGTGKPVFYYDIIKLFSSKKGFFDLKCYTRIKNDRLFFHKDNDTGKFRAKYSIKVAIYSADSDSDIPIKQEFIEKDIFANSFADTENTRIINVNNFSFLLKDGNYRISIISEDKMSKKRHVIEKDVSFFETGGSAVSKLIMIDVENQDRSKINEENIKPLILNVVDKKASYVGAFFQVFSDREFKKYSVRYRVENNKDEIIHEATYERVTKSRENNELIDIGFKNIKIGNYELIVEINIGGRQFVRREHFYIRWKDVSIFVEDISTSINQLVYILESDSIEAILASDDDSKKQWFEEFWSKLETNYGAKKNGLLNEYYKRIIYANNHFSMPHRDGWRSDRGSVYCIMGEPDEIHSYSFPKRGRPYEVWTYYTKGTQYVFEYVGEDYVLRK